MHPGNARRRSARILLALAALCLGLCPPAPAFAGWVDDWIDQRTEIAPGYFEGQKRGYYTAGGFSARWNLQKDYLWSVSPPRLKTGCGGIDAFMGGFSFLNADYLVQKLQRIMSAAPAAAFDIALKVYAPQVAETIAKLENMANLLNSIQLDECKASRALVATIATPFSPESRQGDLAAIQGEWWASTGVGDLWTEFQRQRQADNNQPDPQAAVESMSGCSPAFRAVFGQGSLIDNAAAHVGLNNLRYTELIRGFLGDIFIQEPDPAHGINAYRVVYDQPCDQNKSLQSLLDGSAQGKPPGGDCAPIADANRNLRRYAAVMMTDIAAKYRARAPLSPEEEAFLDINPLSVSLVLRSAVAEDQEDRIIAQLSDITAKAYAYALLLDLSARTTNLFAATRALMSAQAGASGANPVHSCQVENVREAMGAIDTLEEKVAELMTLVQGEYATAAIELNTLTELVAKYQRFNEEIRHNLTGRFGSAVAERAVR
ncbi:conjugal transfer protein TraH [Geoalkalibacter halelectricus]|uniref:Conjugal transfer protein TraH n=1 Tax=Geoalkalibacter halelectricus TaxID=2847045 RepID=A0ABY5ZQX1_9BACT|nr:conjugal transfer protein TraH [Geoalkalibacter halelectricus]MDO3377160.1 conjugal transfer protein TraH [Geoalkalibacter halelectricus]UWZ79626.1 conjugal transfer protein TraH [Geoalkalibacter halelectricus]